MIKCLMSWSSGKDSAWTVHVLRQRGDVEIGALLTTINEQAQRVAMHAVRVDVLKAQAESIGAPLWIVPIPSPCSNEEYEAAMAKAVDRAVRERFTHAAFGDLFLEDIRAYRVEKLNETGITPVFPLWLKPTDALARDMIAGGLQAHLATVDLKKLSADFAGRCFDDALLGDLPAGIDPCGENGEFHSFVTAGPMLSRPIPVRVGETVERDGFAYADLLVA